MAVPKKRKSHSRTGMRRAHKHLHEIGRFSCPRCGTANAPHTVCSNCGQYRGKVVIDVEAETE